jgi:hypothetical protein
MYMTHLFYNPRGLLCRAEINGWRAAISMWRRAVVKNSEWVEETLPCDILCDKKRLCSQLTVPYMCLSRACLGKMRIVLIKTKWLQKRRCLNVLRNSHLSPIVILLELR